MARPRRNEETETARGFPEGLDVDKPDGCGNVDGKRLLDGPAAGFDCVFQPMSALD